MVRVGSCLFTVFVVVRRAKRNDSSVERELVHVGPTKTFLPKTVNIGVRGPWQLAVKEMKPHIETAVTMSVHVFVSSIILNAFVWLGIATKSI